MENDPRPGLPAEPTPGTLEELVRLFAEHVRDRHPNPQRQGCPDAATLRAVASARSRPSDALRRHLMSCAECFRDFQAALKPK